MPVLPWQIEWKQIQINFVIAEFSVHLFLHQMLKGAAKKMKTFNNKPKFLKGQKRKTPPDGEESGKPMYIFCHLCTMYLICRTQLLLIILSLSRITMLIGAQSMYNLVMFQVFKYRSCLWPSRTSAKLFFRISAEPKKPKLAEMKFKERKEFRKRNAEKSSLKNNYDLIKRTKHMWEELRRWVS